MGFYSRVIFPRLCELALGWPAIAQLRREVLRSAAGRILEIGLGTGLNLPCYPAHVRRLTTVDNNPGMHRLAQRRIRATGVRVDHHVVSGEQLPFADQAFDCVVSTFTLCSIDDVRRALAEARRVLAPGGRLLFLEHGLAPEPWVRKWQRRLNWLEGKLADGCRLDRPIDALIAERFGAAACCAGYVEGMPKTHGYLYRGAATAYSPGIHVTAPERWEQSQQ